MIYLGPEEYLKRFKNVNCAEKVRAYDEEKKEKVVSSLTDTAGQTCWFTSSVRNLWKCLLSML